MTVTARGGAHAGEFSCHIDLSKTNLKTKAEVAAILGAGNFQVCLQDKRRLWSVDVRPTDVQTLEAHGGRNVLPD